MIILKAINREKEETIFSFDNDYKLETAINNIEGRTSSLRIVKNLTEDYVLNEEEKILNIMNFFTVNDIKRYILEIFIDEVKINSIDKPIGFSYYFEPRFDDAEASINSREIAIHINY